MANIAWETSKDVTTQHVKLPGGEGRGGKGGRGGRGEGDKGSQGGVKKMSGVVISNMPEIAVGRKKSSYVVNR